MGGGTINILRDGANLGVGQSRVRVETHKRCGNDEELFGTDDTGVSDKRRQELLPIPHFFVAMS